MIADLLVSLPVVFPLAAAAVLFPLRRKSATTTLVLPLFGIILMLLGVLLVHHVWTVGPHAITFGNWPPPFGITFVADLLSASLVLITGVITAAVAVYAQGDVDAAQHRKGFASLVMVLATGVNGAFLTGDIFNLYVWFEVMLIGSFCLLVIGGEEERGRAAVKYVALNLIATLLFLTAVALLYGLAGTLNMADLHRTMAETRDDGTMHVLALLFLAAFGIKAGVFPLFFWLPAAYHTPTATVSALFAALLTKVGVYALIRVFTIIFPDWVMADLQPVFLAIALLTMVVGVLGAAAQSNVRKILSFHIVSQIGYMILGLALFTPLALFGAVFYVLHHIIVKANLFLIAGLIRRLGGRSGSEDLANLGGLVRSAPWLAVLFAIPAISLAGLPPLSGFWAKFLIIKASLDAQAWFSAFIALAVGLLTMYSMSKIWVGAFWKARPDEEPMAELSERSRMGSTAAPWSMILPIAFLAAITVAIGLYAQPLLVYADAAAVNLLNPAAYADLVLGAPRP